jgi:hypothetical protein
MPGIHLLRETYEKKGAAETRKLVTGNITVTEKLDAHRFSFQVNSDKTISFFKKNDNRPLTKVDRVISDLYEKAIDHIKSIPEHIIRNIPEGMRFGFSYFPSEKPLRLAYKFKPKNNMVLTDVTSRNEKGKVKKVYEDTTFLNRWAKVLNVSKPPILFKGVLEMEQIDMLMSIVTGNKKTNAFFTEHIESIFGKTYTKNRIVEAIVIKGKHGLTQLRDPSYKIFDKANTPRVSRDFYDLTLLQINRFMKDYEFPSKFTATNEDERYLEIVSTAFNKFIQEDLIDKDFDPEFLRPKIVGSHGKLGRRHIKVSETLKLVQDPLNEELFKVFVSAFRRKRKPHGLLSEGAVNTFNDVVDRINEIAGSSVYSFKQWQKIYETEDTEDYSKGVDVSEINIKPDPLKVMSSLQLAFTHRTIKKKIGKKKVKVIVGDFNPFNSDHLRIAKKVYVEGSKILFAHISHLNIGYSNVKYECSDQLVEKMLSRITTENPDLIAGHVVIPYHSVGKLFNTCRTHDCEPIELIVPEGTGPNYMSQLYMEEQVLGKRLYASKDFEIKEMKNAIYTDVRRAIEDMDFSSFTKVTPIAIHGFWDNITSEYREWAGINPSRVQN